MPIVGLKIDSINAQRKKDTFSGELKINSAPKIVSAKEITVSAIGKKALALGFEFSTVYGNEIAEIKITGELIYVNDKSAQILKEWKKEKKLPDDVGMEVLNHLFRHCLLKIANISEDLQLPAPLNFPIIKPKTDQANYIG